MATLSARTALIACDSLLTAVKAKLGDAQRAANDGALGPTTMHLAALSQAVTDVHADVRARLALKVQRP